MKMGFGKKSLRSKKFYFLRNDFLISFILYMKFQFG